MYLWLKENKIKYLIKWMLKYLINNIWKIFCISILHETVFFIYLLIEINFNHVFHVVCKVELFNKE